MKKETIRKEILMKGEAVLRSTEILLENLKHYYSLTSNRAIAKKLNLSEAVILNWSAGRSSPSVAQINEIAYMIGIDVSQLIIPNNRFDVYTPIWRDKIKETIINNLKRLKLELDIHESNFYTEFYDKEKMSYRTFLRYINGQNKNLNLKNLDKLANILSVKTYELLERE